jgi:hypothetical protein
MEKKNVNNSFKSRMFMNEMFSLEVLKSNKKYLPCSGTDDNLANWIPPRFSPFEKASFDLQIFFILKIYINQFFLLLRVMVVSANVFRMNWKWKWRKKMRSFRRIIEHRNGSFLILLSFGHLWHKCFDDNTYWFVDFCQRVTTIETV